MPEAHPDLPPLEELHAGLVRRAQARVGSVPGGMRALTRRSDARALGGLALDWLLIVAAVATSEHLGTWWAYLGALVVVTSRISALYFDWFHEALHHNLFRRGAWHARLDFLYGLPCLSSVGIARATHLDHHRDYVTDATAVLGNYDYWGFTPASWERPAFRAWIWFVRPLVGYHTWVYLRDTALDLYEHPRELARCLVFWAVVGGAFVAAGRADLLAWYWFVPLFVLHPPLFFWLDLASHFNVRRSATRDVRGAVFRFVFSPHGRAAWHVVHHLYPGIPWFNLERASRLLVDDADVHVAHGFVQVTRQVLGGTDLAADLGE